MPWIDPCLSQDQFGSEQCPMSLQNIRHLSAVEDLFRTADEVTLDDGTVRKENGWKRV